MSIQKNLSTIALTVLLFALIYLPISSAELMVVGGVNSNVSVRDIYPPEITIILPQATEYTISSLNFNVSLNENGSVWFTLNAGLTNYSMDTENNQTFNYTITLADGTHTALFYANDTGNRISNKSVTFSIDTSGEAPGGGGPGTSSDVIIPPTETDPYNVTFICQQADYFRKIHLINGTLNYTEEEFNYFKNNVVIELGVGISNRVLRAFIENFDGNCPGYGEVPGEDIPEEPVEEKPNLIGLWILICVIILALVIALITNRKYVLALLLLNKRKSKSS
jgi:hypothetical protein